VHRARARLAAAREDDVFLYAAALAFYGLISVVPLVVVALWITSLVVGRAEVHHVADELARMAPPALGADVALERVADLGTTLGLTAVAAALWPATAYGSALVRVLDRLGGERGARGLHGRGVALLLVCLVPVLVLGSLVASYTGAATLGDSGVGTAVGLVLALASGFAAAVATVAAIYKVFPRTPPSRPAILRGALIAAGSISVLSVGYVAYLRVGANFEQRYASAALGAVVLLGVWLFAANTALLVGYRAAHGRDAGPPAEPAGAQALASASSSAVSSSAVSSSSSTGSGFTQPSSNQPSGPTGRPSSTETA
jgi:membrane protein